MPNNKYEISLIMATYGRISAPVMFISRLLESNFDLREVELIIIDQNQDDKLFNVIKDFLEDQQVPIKKIYKKINQKGLANARNYGLKYATGKIIAFPDDDCCYFPDTLSIVNEYFKKYSSVDSIMGKVVDENGKDIIRKWPITAKKITKFNFYTKFSSVGWFLERKSLENMSFCKELGAGCFFGSAEDADLLYQYLKKDKNLFFLPTLKIYHPSSKNENLIKTINYGRGFGAFCRKNIDSFIFMLFIGVLCHHIMKLIENIFLLKKDNLYIRWMYLYSRIQGFILWKN